MNDIKSTTSRTHKISGHGMVVFLSFILSLGAIGGGVYLYYQVLQAKTQFDLKLNDMSNQYTNQLNTNSLVISELKRNVVVIQENMAKLTLMTDINKSKLVIYQLNELINMANQALLVYNDIKGAIQLLTYAQTILSNNTDAGFVALKLALAKNLEQLNQIAPIDTVVIIGKLDAIMTQAQNLPIHKNIIESNNLYDSQQPQQLVNNNLINLWQKFWVNIKRDFAALIKITTPGKLNTIQHNKIVLLPADEIFVRQNIKLYLFNARMSLLQQDQEGWRINLTSAATDFNNYFFIDQQLTNVVNSLNALADINIAHNSVNLNETLQALNSTINVMH